MPHLSKRTIVWVVGTLLSALACLVPARAQLPGPPTLAPELRPPAPRAPLARLETLKDGASQLGCPVTAVDGLGAVTARHCGIGRPGTTRGLTVRFGELRLSVVAARVPEASAYDASGRFAQPQNDWAILELDGRPPRGQTFPYVGRAGLVLADRYNPLVKLGPGRNPNDGPLSGACWPTEIGMDGLVFAFRCTDGTGPGRSGSPLLVRTGHGYGFVGIHVAEYDGPEGKTGIAVVPPPP